SVQVVDHEDLAVAGYDSRTTGEQTIAVAFSDGDVTRTATFTVTVTAGADPAPTLEYIVVSIPATTTAYHLGQNLDLAVLNVASGYSDGTTVPVDPADLLVSGYDLQLEGEQTVTFSFTDGDVTERATFVVNVEPADGPPEPAPAPTDGPSPAP